MKPMNILFTGLVLIALAFTPHPNTIQFYDGPYFSAKELAASTGKLYLIDFSAEWCLPCRWMEENTFSHPGLTSYMDQHVIPVKVDIDDFDGFVLKEQYAVNILPTILIFNSKGEVIKRIEESVDGDRLLSELQAVNIPQNRIITAPSQEPVTNTEALDAPTNTEALDATDTYSDILEAPIRPSFTETADADIVPASEASTAMANPEWFVEPTSAEPILKNPAAASVIETVAEPNIEPTNFEPANVEPAIVEPAIVEPAIVEPTIVEPAIVEPSFMQPTSSNDDALTGYFVQIGSFSEYSNALQRQNEIEANYDGDVIIKTLQGKGQTNYKVLIGLYATYEAAAFDLQDIRAMAGGAFIKKY